MPVIGICGGSGSGKTFLAEAFRRKAGEPACVLSQDFYYLDRSGWTEDAHRALSFDEPRSLDLDALERDVRSLAAGRAVDAPLYCFETHSRRPESRRIEAASILVVEGTLIYSSESLRDVFDLRLYLDVPPDVRLIRRLQRDIVERGRSLEGVVEQWLASVKPMHDRWVEPQAAFAHRVVDGLRTPAPTIVESCLRGIERRVSS